MKKFPEKIICLTEETIETLCLLGAEHLIAGVTAYAERPRGIRRRKKVVSHYTDANIDAILEMKPDLVLVWSDLQANIAAELIRNGVEVHAYNHRNIAGILQMIISLGSLIGKLHEAEKLVEKFLRNIEFAKKSAENLSVNPSVYFEEWYDPLISGIAWVSEIIEICGGQDIFRENRIHHGAKARIIADFDEPVRRNPDIILVSWCGKPFKLEKMKERNGWSEINAVRNGEVHEIPAEIILQPDPAALTDGLNIISNLIRLWNENL